jgi:peptidoglycan/xylan/chitin deacetylase (PgdA/CDA1 family)
MFDRRQAARLVLNLAQASGIGALAGRLMGGVGAILMLHRVTREAPSPLGVNSHLSVTPDFLDHLLGALREDGYALVDMDEAADRLFHPRAGRFVALTADDGFRDNLTEALPVLERHGAPIAIYVAPGLVDGKALLWWEVVDEVLQSVETVLIERERIDCSTPAAKRAAFARLHAHLTEEVAEQAVSEAVVRLAAAAGIDAAGPSSRLLMNWDELTIAAAHPLVTIGAHTIGHVALRRLGETEARRELIQSADTIETRLGARPRHLAYPYGNALAVGEREVRLAAECGFATAVTTRHGILMPRHRAHLHALPRISINGRFQEIGHVSTMLSGLTTPLANRGRRLVTV